MKHLCRCLVAALSLIAPLHAQTLTPHRPVAALRRVVIVSVDGLRPDLLLRAQTPQMHALVRSGSYTFWARTVDEVYTLPAHVSMLTGVVPSRHGVTWDRHIEQAYPKVPTIFELAKRAGYTTAVAAGKTKFVVLTKPGTLDWSFIANEDREDDLVVARHASAMIREHGPDVMLVHLGHADVVGHDSGWGSPEHMRAIEQADVAVGLVLKALAAQRLIESTLVILTADHGGAGLLHSPEDVRSQFIPWIAAGPSVRRNFDLTRVPQLVVDPMSTFATACAVLGIEVEPPTDGKAVREIF